MLKGRMRNHLPYWERYGKQGGLWKVWSDKECYFNVNQKQGKTFLHRLPKKYVAVIRKKQTRQRMIGLIYIEASKLALKEHNRLFQ